MCACKLNGETEKCIIDRGDAKVSRSQHGIRFKSGVINPQARGKPEELTRSFSDLCSFVLPPTSFRVEKNRSLACRQNR